MTSVQTLEPAQYFPLQQGRYVVSPGLYKLGHDFGNGDADKRILQLDRDFRHYRQIKLQCRQTDLSRHFCTQGFAAQIRQTITAMLVNTMIKEHAHAFQLTQTHADELALHCQLTQDTLRFSPDWELIKCDAGSITQPAYICAFDALASQLQEDIVVLRCDHQNHDQTCAIHLCFPNHWAPQEKIGHNFVTVHTHVPGMEKINNTSTKLIETLLHRGPFVRFAWGLSATSELTRLPQTTAPNTPNTHAQELIFDVKQPRLYLRTERQVILGIAHAHAIVFLIRTYFTDCLQIKNNPLQIRLLLQALESMSEQTLAYKGLTHSKAQILQWLRS